MKKYCVLPEWHTRYTHSFTHICMHTHTHTHVPTPNQVLSDHSAFGLAQVLMFHYNKDTQWAISAFPQWPSKDQRHLLESPTSSALLRRSSWAPGRKQPLSVPQRRSYWIHLPLESQDTSQASLVDGLWVRQSLVAMTQSKSLVYEDFLSLTLLLTRGLGMFWEPPPPQCAPLPHVLRFSHCLVTLLDPPRPPTALSCSVLLFIRPWGCPDTSGKLVTLLVTYCCVLPSTGHRSSVLMSGDLK